MTGWIGDFFRFWWALFYWNSRKGWFRLRGAHRDDCPCQTYNDSGIAYQSRCEAVAHWHKPERFRRVCPLLTETPDGWRCAAEAERVRPFWSRAALYSAGALLGLYLTGTVLAFAALRAARYEISYSVVAWPPRWSEFRGAQERLYATRAQAALARGNYQEAILALEMVCQINPQNYNAGLALAALAQASGQPHISDHIYERLMQVMPGQRVQTAQIWFRTLLAQASYEKIISLAAAMLSEDPEQRGVWLNALLFAARQSRGAESLHTVLQENPHLPDWCTVIISLELALLENRLDSALPGLTHVHRQPASPYLPYYQVERLLRHGRPDLADTLLNAYGGSFPATEAAFLRLQVFRTQGAIALLDPAYDNLLRNPLTPLLATKFCSYLIANGTPGQLARYLDRFATGGPTLTAETLPLYQATYVVAALAGDQAHADRIHEAVAKFSSSDYRALNGLAELLKTRKPDGRMPRLLPLVQLPIEVLYAILEPPASAAAK